MTFNIPVESELVSTSVVDSTPLFDPDQLYLYGDEVQYSDAIYIMGQEKATQISDFNSSDAYDRGDYTVYSGVASALERAVSQAINVPLTASASYDAPTFEQIAEANNIKQIWGKNFGVPADKIKVIGNILYLYGLASTTLGTLTIFDITDKDNIIKLGSFTSSQIWGVSFDVIGSTAFVVGRQPPIYTSGFITALDVSTPSSITITSQLVSASIANPENIIVPNNYAFITCGNSFVSVDITNTSAMAVSHAFTSASLSDTSGLALIGEVTALVASRGTDSLTAINITNPTAMIELDSYTSTNLDGAGSIAYHGDTAHVLSGNLNKVTSIDITNLSALSELGTLTITGLVENSDELLVVNDFVYIANRISNYITVIDVFDPSNMIERSRFNATGVDGITLSSDSSEILVSNDVYGGFFSLSATANRRGNDIGLYNFFTTKYDTNMDITITRISDSVVMATGEFYYEDSESHISRYYGTGCTTGCGANRLVWIGDDKLYVFTASYTHTNGAVAADFRDTYLSAYGFLYLRPTLPGLPFDTKQYTSVIDTGTQTWTITSTAEFNGIALGRIVGDTVSVTFKDSVGTTIAQVTDYEIPCTIDSVFDPEPATVILYATVAGELQTVEANGTIEVTITGASGTELGAMFPFVSYDAGATDLSFSHDIKNFDRDNVSAISGAVDHIKGNRVSQHKGSFYIPMTNYDKMVLLNKKIVKELIAIDGSDTIDNAVADGATSFDSTKLIGRIQKLGMASKAIKGKIPNIVPVTIDFLEVV